MRVFLDDVRTPPDTTWRLVLHAADAIALLATGGVTEISLDNDLGENEPEGFTVANWIERQAFTHPTFVIPVVRVHSANPVARQRMRITIERIERARASRGS
jgi:hypothetical protein